jgi:flagellin
MLSIKNNLMAGNASRHLSETYGTLAKSVERMSSGLRINSAADDAAGLAVRELMRADVAVLDQGTRNAQDAVSLLMTAEGALQVVDEKLIRMKELAEQAATGTYTSAQRSIMNDEFSEMAAEIDRIAQATDFNGIHMLNSSASLTIHFGTGTSSAEDYYSIDMADVTTSALGIASADISSASGAVSALALLESAIVTKDEARAQFGAKANRLEATVLNLSIQAEKLTEAEGRISDADVATEMTKFARNQVLAQAGVAMLAQANTVPQMALSLLR